MTSPRKRRVTRRSPEGLALSGYCLGAIGTAKTPVCSGVSQDLIEQAIDGVIDETGVEELLPRGPDIVQP
jgi:hypothetical protein